MLIREELVHAENRWHVLCGRSKDAIYKLSLFCDVLLEKKLRAEKRLALTFETFSKKIDSIEYSMGKKMSDMYMKRLHFVYDWKKLNLILELIRELEDRVKQVSHRKKHTKSQLTVLEEWWSEHLNNPYPQKSDITNLFNLYLFENVQQMKLFDPKGVFQNAWARAFLTGSTVSSKAEWVAGTQLDELHSTR